MSQWNPIQFIITKVHSLCNINCSYCYEYNMGNTGWKTKPKNMSLETFEVLCQRVAEHNTGDEPFISFHGGEPLIRSPRFFDDAMTLARQYIPTAKFGLQTNAMLLNQDFIDVFRKHGVRAGTSLDGPKLVNDAQRIDHKGRGTFDRVMKGVNLMRDNPDVWGGILGVIDVASDPTEILDFYAELNPPALDLLEPDGNWNKLPPGKAVTGSTEYGEWLTTAYDHWYRKHPTLQIRRFEEVMEHCLGGPGTTEYFGVEPKGLVTVATDGAFEAVDQIKSAFDGAEYTGLDVFTHTLDDVVAHESTQARITGMDALASECVVCEHVLECGGGYFPHRYSEKTGYRTPSIYCADYKVLFTHIKNHLTAIAATHFEVASQG
ncbi:radical SAM protein [Porticoccaceae bacterium]|nr:radical SAM protein [Porticoccaceae bacterium]